ncbi:MAG: hypothetical protein K1X94_01275 [Sandaracinaceae bacterium]|nr:hypothetical protein [Sandaracinaceae bacterium]
MQTTNEPRARGTRADGRIAKASPVGFVVSACVRAWRDVVVRSACAGVIGLAGCRCEDPAPPSTYGRPSESIAEPPSELVLPPLVAPAPPAPDGVEIPPTLTRQLRSVAATTHASAPAADPLADCASGCALLDERGRLVLVVPDLDARGVPEEIALVRVIDHELEREPISLDGLEDAIARFAAEGGSPPWDERVRRALGAGPYRSAEPLIAARARTLFAIEEYAPLVALGGPFSERWLYAEVGRSAYRVHLLRSDRSVDRLLATKPLVAAACTDADAERACIAPLAIDEVFSSDDHGVLVALVHHPMPDDTNSEVVLLRLDDASVLPSAEDEGTRRSDLERSLEAPGAHMTVLAPAAGLEDRDARCARGCALFREDASAWIVRPTRIEHGAPTAVSLFSPDGDELELLPTGSQLVTAPALVAQALATAGAPDREGRALVARQALESDHGLAAAPLVELRTPHVGAQVSVSFDDREYVVRWTQSGTTYEVGRVPAIRRGDAFAAPTVSEIFAPPDAGFPVVVIGVAAVRDASDPHGVAYQVFHVVIPGPPRAER